MKHRWSQPPQEATTAQLVDLYDAAHCFGRSYKYKDRFIVEAPLVNRVALVIFMNAPHKLFVLQGDARKLKAPRPHAEEDLVFLWDRAVPLEAVLDMLRWVDKRMLEQGFADADGERVPCMETPEGFRVRTQEYFDAQHPFVIHNGTDAKDAFLEPEIFRTATDCFDRTLLYPEFTESWVRLWLASAKRVHSRMMTQSRRTLRVVEIPANEMDELIGEEYATSIQ